MHVTRPPNLVDENPGFMGWFITDDLSHATSSVFNGFGSGFKSLKESQTARAIGAFAERRPIVFTLGVSIGAIALLLVSAPLLERVGTALSSSLEGTYDRLFHVWRRDGSNDHLFQSQWKAPVDSKTFIADQEFFSQKGVWDFIDQKRLLHSSDLLDWIKDCETITPRHLDSLIHVKHGIHIGDRAAQIEFLKKSNLISRSDLLKLLRDKGGLKPAQVWSKLFKLKGITTEAHKWKWLQETFFTKTSLWDVAKAQIRPVLPIFFVAMGVAMITHEDFFGYRNIMEMMIYTGSLAAFCGGGAYVGSRVWQYGKSTIANPDLPFIGGPHVHTPLA